MFKINRQTDDAIRVLLALARIPNNTRLSTAEVQHGMQIPRAFLQCIVADLAKGGLVQTFPGTEGGLQLAHSPSEIPFFDVVDLIEGPLDISECLHSEVNCPVDSPCPVRGYWQRLQQTIIITLKHISFQQLLEDPQPGFPML